MTRLAARRTFLVSRQLRCVQQGRPAVMREYGYQLIGAGSGDARPTIKLADNAGSISGGILIYFQLVISADEWPYKGSGPDPPSHYSAMLRDVQIDMGSNRCDFLIFSLPVFRLLFDCISADLGLFCTAMFPASRCPERNSAASRTSGSVSPRPHNVISLLGLL